MLTWKEAFVALGVALVLAMGSVPLAGLLISKGRCAVITLANSEACFGYMAK